MHGAERVGEGRDDRGGTRLFDHARGFQQRVDIMHGVEHHIARDAVGNQAVVDQLHEVGMLGFPGDEAQTGADELQRRVGGSLMHEADAFPGIFFVGAHGYAHVGAGGEVQSKEADAVHDRRDGDEVAGGQARSAPEGLVAVACRNVD